MYVTPVRSFYARKHKLSFDELQRRFPRATVLGIRRTDQSDETVLAPPPHTPVSASDAVVLVAASRTEAQPSGLSVIAELQRCAPVRAVRTMLTRTVDSLSLSGTRDAKHEVPEAQAEVRALSLIHI
mgnify:FL=1